MNARPSHLAVAHTEQAADSQRQRIRWFVGVHIAVVLAIFATAVAIGGGLGSPPFPPDLPVRRAAQADPDMAARGLGAHTSAPSAHDSRPEWTRRADLAAPWDLSAAGTGLPTR